MPPAKYKLRTVIQNFIDDNHPPIVVYDDLLESALTKEFLDDFFEGSPLLRRVGLAPIFTQKGSLSHIVIAIKTKAMVVQFHAKGKGSNAYLGREILSTEVLCNPDVTLLAFDFDKIAIPLFADQNIRVLNAVDIQSAFGLETNRKPLLAIKFAVGDRATVWKDNIDVAFATSTLESKRTTSFVLKAWVAQCLPMYEGMEDRIQSAAKINTQGVSEMRLRHYAGLERGEQRLALNQTTSTTHEYSSVNTHNDTANVQASRYQSRFMRSDRLQRVNVHDLETGIDFVAQGEIFALAGRKTKIRVNANLNGRVITGILTEGPDGPTNADKQRSLIVRQALQGRANIFENPFLQYIFDPPGDFAWPDTFPVVDVIPPIITQRVLNDSQKVAVEHMLMNTNNTRLIMIQGPPGTGKTSVIATFVCSAVAANIKGIWLMAQSNIAVKNIAEKLANVGFTNWRLLVSQDFQQGWHDHIYREINKNIIRSDEFRSARRRVEGVPVILCTLSMLANTRINIFTETNPIEIVVMDEASQITLGSYVAPLQMFPTIHKICMIGDDKQLPPYGAEGDNNIQSIFEVPHLQASRLFLQIQYRMPPQIGEVISDVVYEGQLQSNPGHPVPISESSCYFVHVEDSEEREHETSYHNPAERAAVLKIAEKLQVEEKEFCIISPYDAQRSFLENDLQKAGLAWEDKCFNVDSFQGNERDYVVVSLVRSKRLGFLSDLRRTNVMLTRCKRGMYIVTSWGFVFGVAANTLVGRMAASWDDKVWVLPQALIAEV